MNRTGPSSSGRAVGVALLALALSALASPALSADAELRSRVIIRTDGNVHVQQGADEATATVESDGLFGTGTSRAGFGTLSASAFASAEPTQTTEAVSVDNELWWLDTLTIVPAPGSVPTDPLRPIIVGEFTGAVTVTGTEPSWGDWVEFMTVVPNVPFLGTLTSAARLEPGTTTVSSLFVIGNPFELSTALATTAIAYGDGAGAPPLRSAVDVTVRWEGISQVEVAGAIVPYTVTSASGTNWALAAPIPEPPIFALIALGLGTLTMRLRHKSRKPPPSGTKEV